MEHQARAWVFKRLLSLHTTWKTYFMDVMQSVQETNDTQMTVKIDHQAMMVINKILDLYVEADLGVRIRTDGFHMALGVDRRLAGAVTAAKPSLELNEIYRKMEKARVTRLRGFLKTAVAQIEAEARRSNSTPWFMKPVTRMTSREFAHKKCQNEFENPLPLKMESWVQDINDGSTERFGFVVYRVSYAQSNEQWIKFLGQLEGGLNGGWVGIVDSNGARKKATLEWIDGREYGVAEGDLDGVRR